MKNCIYLILVYGLANVAVAGEIRKTCHEAFSAEHQNHPVQKPVPSKSRLRVPVPDLEFGENFSKGHIEGSNSYFIVRLTTLENQRIIPVRFIEKIGESQALVEIVHPADGNIRVAHIQLKPMSQGGVNITSIDYPSLVGIARQGRPDMEAIFNAIRSDTRELFYKDRSHHNLNGQALREPQLKAQGFGPAWIRSIDEMSHWRALKREWIKGKVNPYKTHIEYLAESITDHINYIKKGIRSLTTTDLRHLAIKLGSSQTFIPHFKEKTMDRITQLEQKVEKASAEKQFTYQRFLEFIVELSQATHYKPYSPDNIKKKIPPNFLEAFLDYFPLIIAVPVKGEIGIMALNESGPEGIYPLGLTYQVQTVDGHPHWLPVEFTLHDIFHAFNSMRLRVTSENTAHQLFHHRWIKLRESLLVPERKNVELAYYMLTHEDSYQVFVNHTLEEMQAVIQQVLLSKIKSGHNFKGIKDFSKNPEKSVSEVAHDWVKVYESLSKDLGFL